MIDNTQKNIIQSNYSSKDQFEWLSLDCNIGFGKLLYPTILSCQYCHRIVTILCFICINSIPMGNAVSACFVVLVDN